MALPQTVVDRLTREPANTPGWSSRLLLFSFTIALLMVLLYAGLEYWYLPKLDGDQSRLDQAIQTASNGVPQADQARLASFYSQLANIRTLLGVHIVASPLFAWLERATLPNVYLSRLSLTSSNRQLLMNGAARSMRDIADQITLFQAQPETNRVLVNNVSADANGLWRFDIMLEFNPDFFAAASQIVQP
jgi:hypothetical protein